MKRLFLLPVTLAAVGFCGGASAQASGFYLGAQVGVVNVDVDCPAGASCDDSDTAFKLYGGYNLTPEWALELGYSDFGEVTATAGASTTKLESTNFGFGAAYRISFASDWSGVARFGLARNETEQSAPGFASESRTKTKPYLGLGVGYALSEEISLTGVWDWTEFEDSDGDKAKFNAFSIGLNFAF